MTQHLSDINHNEMSNVCPGVWLSLETPSELISNGELLSKEDFHMAANAIGQNQSQGTYAFNYLIFSLSAVSEEDGNYGMDIFYGLKNPSLGMSDSFYIECQAAHDMLIAHKAGEVALIGFGPKTIAILDSVIFDNDLVL